MKQRKTFYIDEKLIEKVEAASSLMGMTNSGVIEQALKTLFASDEFSDLNEYFKRLDSGHTWS